MARHLHCKGPEGSQGTQLLQVQSLSLIYAQHITRIYERSTCSGTDTCSIIFKSMFPSKVSYACRRPALDAGKIPHPANRSPALGGNHVLPSHSPACYPCRWRSVPTSFHTFVNTGLVSRRAVNSLVDGNPCQELARGECDVLGDIVRLAFSRMLGF